MFIIILVAPPLFIYEGLCIYLEGAAQPAPNLLVLTLNEVNKRLCPINKGVQNLYALLIISSQTTPSALQGAGVKRSLKELRIDPSRHLAPFRLTVPGYLQGGSFYLKALSSESARVEPRVSLSLAPELLHVRADPSQLEGLRRSARTPIYDEPLELPPILRSSSCYSDA